MDLHLNSCLIFIKKLFLENFNWVTNSNPSYKNFWRFLNTLFLVKAVKLEYLIWFSNYKSKSMHTIIHVPNSAEVRVERERSINYSKEKMWENRALYGHIETKLCQTPFSPQYIYWWHPQFTAQLKNRSKKIRTLYFVRQVLRAF